MKTKLCIFDLDGTLLNTLDDIGNSMTRVLAANGFAPLSMQEYMASVGHGARNLLLSVLPPGHGLSEGRIEEMLAAFRAEYSAHSMDLTRPYDGIPELLKYLKDNGVKLAVVSNKQHNTTAALLNAYFGDVAFDAVFGEQPGRPIKPDPASAFDILALTGVPPEQAVVIGDADTDIIFAKNASLFSIGVLWGFRSREVLEACGADVIVDSPEQVKEYL